ncbi:MAG: TonB-dependent receptor [Halieaceae bacterium]|nr:TonB-dependent receptor [Halieaceae bacterium]
MKQRRSISIAALGFFYLCCPVLAAPALEEIIVTAEKRAESLQDVPISIVAFSQDRLEQLGINDIKGLASTVPNLLVQEFTGSSTTVRLFIRGVGQNDVQITQDPSVALYMDGVYIGSSVGTAFETADTERIEVLRGPQGTLYGRNATGGAINIITRPADTEALDFRQSLQVGNYGLFRSSSILNLPITDNTAVKFAYTAYDRDGIVDNKGRGADFGIEDRNTFIGDFHWTISDRQALDYKYEHSSTKDTARLSQALGFDRSQPLASAIVFENPEVDAAGNPVEATDDRLDEATSFDFQEKGDNKIKAYTLNYALEINETLSFKSITGYRDLNGFTQNAQAPTAALFGDLTITNGLPQTDFNQFTQELQLLGETDALTWVGGLFYYEDDGEENQPGNSGGTENLPPGVLVDFTKTKNSSAAIFGQATWTPAALNDRWHFTLGARYSDDSRKATRDNNRVSFTLGQPNGIEPFRAKYDKDFSKFNPSVTVQYDLNEFSNVYAKAVSAYKSGGTSQRSTSRANFEMGFDEEDLVSYEVGYKGDLLNGRLRLNGAIFYMEYDDYQQSVPTGNNAGERDFINIDDANIKGLEWDISAAITDEITASLNYGYLDTSFGPSSVSYLALDATSPDGTSTVTEILTDDLALAPKHSATLSLEYTRPVSIGVFNANINVLYQDSTNSGVTVPTGYMDERTLVGANLTLSQVQLGREYGELKIMLWGKNLLDEEYYIGNIRQTQFDQLGFSYGVATFGDPLTYGVTLEYQYQ